MIKIVFFGSSKHVIPIIKALQENFDLTLVVTTEKEPIEPVTAFCRKGNIPYLAIKQFDNETIEKIKKYNAPLAVLAYFGLILPQDLLDLFPKGIMNIHPSLLPKYRGSTPVQTAILNRGTKTGVTIIKLDNQVDHGPILAQKEVEINSLETADSLHERLFKLGATMLPSIIKQYNNEAITLVEQNHKKATFTKGLTRNSGFIDISKPVPKQIIDRMIRAYYPWPGVWTRQIINNKSSIIKFLPERRIQLEGKKPTSYKDFLNGYPHVQEELKKLLKN